MYMYEKQSDPHELSPLQEIIYFNLGVKNLHAKISMWKI